MQELKSLQIAKLKKQLKKFLDKNLIDIFLIGSFLKNKISPRDIDIILLFKEKSLSEIENVVYEIQEETKIKNIHIESIFIDSMLKEKIFTTILHEGISIKNNKKVSEILEMNSFILFKYNLQNLDKLKKVQFAQALHGRKKQGFLSNEKGISLGQGSFMVPVEKEEIFKEFFKKWKINFSRKRIFITEE